MYAQVEDNMFFTNLKLNTHEGNRLKVYYGNKYIDRCFTHSICQIVPFCQGRELALAVEDGQRQMQFTSYWTWWTITINSMKQPNTGMSYLVNEKLPDQYTANYATRTGLKKASWYSTPSSLIAHYQVSTLAIIKPGPTHPA
jgi:hypothetical protein